MDRKPAKSFTDLVAWQKGHELVLRVYRITESFPRRLWKLISQMQGAAASICANIAEGFRRRSKPDKVRLLNIALGSLDETHYFLILARDLGYAKVETEMALTDEVGRLLYCYIEAIQRSRGE